MTLNWNVLTIYENREYIETTEYKLYNNYNIIMNNFDLVYLG